MTVAAHQRFHQRPIRVRHVIAAQPDILSLERKRSRIVRPGSNGVLGLETNGKVKGEGRGVKKCGLITVEMLFFGRFHEEGGHTCQAAIFTA